MLLHVQVFASPLANTEIFFTGIFSHMVQLFFYMVPEYFMNMPLFSCGTCFNSTYFSVCFSCTETLTMSAVFSNINDLSCTFKNI